MLRRHDSLSFECIFKHCSLKISDFKPFVCVQLAAKMLAASICAHCLRETVWVQTTETCAHISTSHTEHEYWTEFFLVPHWPWTVRYSPFGTRTVIPEKRRRSLLEEQQHKIAICFFLETAQQLKLKKLFHKSHLILDWTVFWKWGYQMPIPHSSNMMTIEHLIPETITDSCSHFR